MNQKRWGRIFALFSAICFCLSACLVQFSGGTASAAEEDAVYNGYSYQISQDGSAVITGCEKNWIYLSLPSQIFTYSFRNYRPCVFWLRKYSGDRGSGQCKTDRNRCLSGMHQFGADCRRKGRNQYREKHHGGNCLGKGMSG